MMSSNWKRSVVAVVLLTTAACSKSVPKEDGKATGASVGAPAVGGKGDSLRHLPPGCQVAGRLELDQVMASPALAPHQAEFGGALEQHTSGGKVPVLSRLFQQLGIDVKSGLGRASFCLRDATQVDAGKVPFLVAVSGAFEPNSVLNAMLAAAPAGRFTERKLDGARVLARQGKLFTQAEDGVLLVASDEPTLLAGLSTSEAYKSYALPDGGAVSIFATETALRTLNPKSESSAVAHPVEVEVAKANRLDLRVSLEPGQFAAHLAFPTPQQAALSASRLSRILAPFTEAGKQQEYFKTRFSPEMLESLKGASFEAKDSTVTVNIPLSSGMLGELLHGFALFSAVAQAQAKAPGQDAGG